MKDLINYDLIKQGIPDNAKYEQVKKKMLETYIKRDILTRENIKEVTTKRQYELVIKLRLTVHPEEDPLRQTKNQASLLKQVRSHSSKHWIDKCLGVTRKISYMGLG